MIALAIPVKDLANVKQRLLPALGGAERAALARAMLRDVLRSVTGARVDVVWVVTHDAEVMALARDHGATVLAEGENAGHTAAVARAQARAVELGAQCFITVPGDVPCVTAGEIQALAEAVAGTGPAVALVPSRSGLGTNGAALRPPGVMPLRFGEPSFDNHVAAVRARGLVPRILPLPCLALDVDDAEDLRELLARGPDTESGRLVRGWPVARRLAAAAPGAA